MEDLGYIAGLQHEPDLKEKINSFVQDIGYPQQQQSQLSNKIFELIKGKQEQQSGQIGTIQNTRQIISKDGSEYTY